MAIEPKTRYTYADLEGFPEDNFRREIIDGELIVTAAPATRHQDAVVELTVEFHSYAKAHGGRVYPAPTDVFFSDSNLVEPDVLFVAVDRLAQVEKRFVRSAPTIVVEVSSPSTLRLDLVRKRDLYERFEVPEYWFVDLDGDRVEVYRLDPRGRYGPPVILSRGGRLESPLLPGFTMAVDRSLGPPEEDDA
jgi:Uma2 family endonuclease